MDLYIDYLNKEESYFYIIPARALPLKYLLSVLNIVFWIHSTNNITKLCFQRILVRTRLNVIRRDVRQNFKQFFFVLVSMNQISWISWFNNTIKEIFICFLTSLLDELVGMKLLYYSNTHKFQIDTRTTYDLNDFEDLRVTANWSS